MSIKIEIKIRINPCLALNFEKDDTHHSKTWVIIRVLDELDVEGKKLTEVTTQLRDVAHGLLDQIRNCYLVALENGDVRGAFYRVSMKYAAIEDTVHNLADLYLNLDSDDEAIDRICNDSNMAGSLGDLIRLQHQLPDVLEDPIEALRWKKDEQILQVGSEETDFVQVCRIKIDEKGIDVSGITMVPTSDLGTKNDLLYESFLPLALRFSWGL